VPPFLGWIARIICASEMNMELLNELGNDLAIAILIEKRHAETIPSAEITDLIGRVKTLLEPIVLRQCQVSAAPAADACISFLSH
jgi:hypothetical protein